jgi:hypothetical protein
MSKRLFLSALVISLVGNVVYQFIDRSLPGDSWYPLDRGLEQFAFSLPVPALRPIVAAKIITERFEELDQINQIHENERDEKRQIYEVLEITFPHTNQSGWDEIKKQYTDSRNQGMTASHSASLVQAVRHISSRTK